LTQKKEIRRKAAPREESCAFSGRKGDPWKRGSESVHFGGKGGKKISPSGGGRKNLKKKKRPSLIVGREKTLLFTPRKREEERYEGRRDDLLYSSRGKEKGRGEGDSSSSRKIKGGKGESSLFITPERRKEGVIYEEGGGIGKASLNSYLRKGRRKKEEFSRSLLAEGGGKKGEGNPTPQGKGPDSCSFDQKKMGKKGSITFTMKEKRGGARKGFPLITKKKERKKKRKETRRCREEEGISWRGRAEGGSSLPSPKEKRKRRERYVFLLSGERK